jgi:hypothetical protein
MRSDLHLISTPANPLELLDRDSGAHSGYIAIRSFAVAVVRGLRRLLQRPHLDDAVRNSAGSS